jgi:hypothetical protein
MKTLATILLATALFTISGFASDASARLRASMQHRLLHGNLDVLAEHQKRVLGMMLELRLEIALAVGSDKEVDPAQKRLEALKAHREEIQKEIASVIDRLAELEQSTEAAEGSKTSRLEEELKIAQAELAALRVRYKEKYPAVIQVKEKIRVLQEAVEKRAAK